MRALRRLLRSDRVRSLGCDLAALYFRFCYATQRRRVVNADVPEALWQRREPFIVAFWHGRLTCVLPGWRRDRPVAILVSQHRDGELVARTFARFGIGAIRGSTHRPDKARRRGGLAAARETVRRIRDGSSVAITPDGPRGPRMRAGDGIAALARLSGARIVPVGCSASRRFRLSTWDAMTLPLPFGRAVYVWGEPLSVAGDADGGMLERTRQAVERELNRLTAEADRLAGHAPTKPAAERAAA